jgi:hypothetical protein
MLGDHDPQVWPTGYRRVTTVGDAERDRAPAKEVVGHHGDVKFLRWLTWRRVAMAGGLVLLGLGGYVALDNQESTPALAAGVVLFSIGLLADRITELTAKHKDTEIKATLRREQAESVLVATAVALAEVDATPLLPAEAKERIEEARAEVGRNWAVMTQPDLPDDRAPSTAPGGSVLVGPTGRPYYYGPTMTSPSYFMSREQVQGNAFTLRVRSSGALYDPSVSKLRCVLTGSGGRHVYAERNVVQGRRLEEDFRFPADFDMSDLEPHLAEAQLHTLAYGLRSGPYQDFDAVWQTVASLELA